jgi:hypothetical protein
MVDFNSISNTVAITVAKSTCSLKAGFLTGLWQPQHKLALEVPQIGYPEMRPRPAASRRISRCNPVIRLRSRLHPPPGSGSFASMIPRPENCTGIINCFNYLQICRFV